MKVHQDPLARAAGLRRNTQNLLKLFSFSEKTGSKDGFNFRNASDLSGAQIRSHAQKFFNRLEREVATKGSKNQNSEIQGVKKEFKRAEQNRMRSAYYSTTISSMSPGTLIELN